MSTGGAIFGAMFFVLALILTFTFLVLRRQLHLARSRFDAVGSSVPHGPEVGNVLPTAVRRRRPELSKGARTLLFLEGNCPDCHETARDSGLERLANVLAVVTGEPQLTAGIVESLPRGVLSITGEEAMQIQRALWAEATPFAVQLADGLVTAKGYVANASAVAALQEAGRRVGSH